MGPSLTSRDRENMVLIPRPATHTLLGMELATNPRLEMRMMYALSSMDTLSSLEVMSLLFRMPLPTLDQSPLLPMLPHGPATLVESSMVPAAMLLTIVSPW